MTVVEFKVEQVRQQRPNGRCVPSWLMHPKDNFNWQVYALMLQLNMINVHFGCGLYSVGLRCSDWRLP